MLDTFLLAFALRQQVNGGIEPQVIERQVGTGWINPVKPIQKRLCWFNNDCGTVDHLHTCARSSCRAMIVVQQPSQTLTTLDGSAIFENLVLRHDQPITEALMVAFVEIMGYELLNSSS